MGPDALMLRPLSTDSTPKPLAPARQAGMGLDGSDKWAGAQNMPSGIT